MKAAVRADDLETLEPIVGPDAQGGHRINLVFHRHTGALIKDLTGLVQWE